MQIIGDLNVQAQWMTAESLLEQDEEKMGGDAREAETIDNFFKKFCCEGGGKWGSGEQNVKIFLMHKTKGSLYANENDPTEMGKLIMQCKESSNCWRKLFENPRAEV